jgi:L-seryl-tRNA(Ser) seleniumtransferase
VNHGTFAGLLDEPSATNAVRTRVDLVCFSGDKLLGGPQAGLIVGRQKMITALMADPLYRALRPDKLAIGLLERTLLSYLNKANNLPCWEMASLPVDALKKGAEEIVSLIDSQSVSSVALKSSFGGGSLPEYEFDSYGIRIAGDPVILSSRLREFTIPVICRSASGGVLIDMRTVLPEYHSLLADAIRSCL